MTKTKLTIEVTVETQFGPASAINVLRNLVNGVPAVTNTELIKLKTDYKFPEVIYPANVELLAVTQIPFTLK